MLLGVSGSCEDREVTSQRRHREGAGEDVPKLVFPGRQLPQVSLGQVAGWEHALGEVCPAPRRTLEY